MRVANLAKSPNRIPGEGRDPLFIRPDDGLMDPGFRRECD
jgi:hypothetical protein